MGTGEVFHIPAGENQLNSISAESLRATNISTDILSSLSIISDDISADGNCDLNKVNSYQLNSDSISSRQILIEGMDIKYEIDNLKIDVDGLLSMAHPTVTTHDKINMRSLRTEIETLRENAKYVSTNLDAAIEDINKQAEERLNETISNLNYVVSQLAQEIDETKQDYISLKEDYEELSSELSEADLENIGLRKIIEELKEELNLS